MEQKFVKAWAENRARAGQLGVRMRPVAEDDALKWARRCLSGSRPSDGFDALADRNRLDLSPRRWRICGALAARGCITCGRA